MVGRQPPVGVLGADAAVSRAPRPVSRVPVASALAAGLVVLLVLTGCSGGTGSTAEGGPAGSVGTDPASGPGGGSGSGRAGPGAEPRAPREGACYALTLDQALAATSDVGPRGCAGRHTSRTYLVGEVDAVVDGHLLAIDSAQVQAQVAEVCPDALPDFLGGSLADQRLSVLRPVWFTPSLEQADAGATWLRCDVVAVDARSGDDGLAQLSGRLGGILSSGAGRDRWGLCATGAPDDAQARRVPCSADHSWRAVEVVDLGGGSYPGAEQARRAGQDRCEAVGRERAEDPLTFEWGYEWPTQQQWAAGQTFGRCWVPDGVG